MTARNPADGGKVRLEADTFGAIEVPADRYWGAQAQRSLANFRIGWEKQPQPIVRALGIIKRAAAETNMALGHLDKALGETIVNAIPDIGYLHTGIEKNMEAKTYLKAEVMSDRLDYMNNMGNNLAYCMAVEKLVELDVPGDGDVPARVAEMCEKLLANPLIESYEVEPLRDG